VHQSIDHHGHDPNHAHHDHEHEHDHAHDHGTGLRGWLGAFFHLNGHRHDHGDLARDQAFNANAEGIRTIWLALAALGVTSLLQLIIVWLSGSVALLADTAHNIVDALNSIPLLLAFYLARRAATRRYTYGFGRAEDVAGIFIVLSIAVSAGVIFWESISRFFAPEPLENLGWVVAAALIGFVGNEAVALLQIRTGRRIGSAAMVADGLHARTDGLTSLAVLVAAVGSWLGYTIVDPIVGLLIGLAILFITKDAAVTMWHRLMDAIEPELLAQAEQVVGQQPAVRALRRLRMRWIGHQLHAEVYIAVDPQMTTAASHVVAEEVRHALFHALPKLAEVVVHVDPWSPDAEQEHQLTLHHEPAPQPLTQ
jgi:cation diffusion facilitator family transporter